MPPASGVKRLHLAFRAFILILTVGSTVPAQATYNVTDVIPFDALTGPYGFHATGAFLLSHPMAVNPVTNHIYVSDGTKTVVVDGNTRAILKTLPVGGKLFVNPATNRVYVMNAGLTVIDGETDAILVTYTLPGEPLEAAVDEVLNRIYLLYPNSCTGFCEATVMVLNGANHNLLPTIRTGIYNPRSLAVDSSAHRVYVHGYTPDNQILPLAVAVLDGETLQHIPIRNDPYRNTSGQAYITDLAVNSKLHQYYLVRGDLGNYGEDLSYDVLNGTTNSLVRHINLDFPDYENGTYPTVLVPPQGDRIVVLGNFVETMGGRYCGYLGPETFIFTHDAVTQQKLGRLSFAGSFIGAAMNSTTGRLYVWSKESKAILVLEDGPARDAVPPRVTITTNPPMTSPEISTANSIQVTLRGMDNEGGLGMQYVSLTRHGARSSCSESYSDTLTYSFTNNFMVHSQARGMTSLTAIDLAGNIVQRTFNLNYDPNPPVTTASSVPETPGILRVTLTATDDVSGVGETWYQVDEGALALYTGPITVSADRAHSIRYYSRDFAGNTEEAKTLTTTVVTLGDINSDGDVDVQDAVLALRYTSGGVPLTPGQIDVGDMNRDTKLDVTDAVLILRRAVGLPL